MSAAMLILRVLIGGLFVGHGLQKLFGWFGGPGLDGMAGALDSMGYRPARKHALFAGLTEAGGGAMLVLGLLTPLAAAAVIGMMLNATLAVHRENGLWVQDNGFEYPLVLGTAAFAIAVTGPGAASLDGALGWHMSGGWGVLSLVLGLLVGMGVYATRQDPQQATAQQAQGADDEHEERRAA